MSAQPNSRLEQSAERPGLGKNPDLRDPALAYVTPPPSLRLVASILAVLFLVLPLLLMALPWQQSAVGSGRVIAHSPAERQQVVDAPVDGRLEHWLVTEGDVVAKGDPLVQLVDNDADFVARLEAQREVTLQEQAAVATQIASYEAKLAALQASVELVVAEYDSKIAELGQKRVADRAALQAAQSNQVRVITLANEGIASERDRELAILKLDEANAKVEARDAELEMARQAKLKARAEAETKVASTRAEVETARSKQADVQRKLLELNTKQARQNTQLVTAPRDGTVLRLYGGPGGGQVKKGDPLLTLIPMTTSRIAELWIHGNDMPFVQQDARVRLVFEGWPALQVVGLPGASQGTFGGTVAFVDATDDGSGKFRVVVVQDPAEPWPDGASLRQGVRVKGWLLLGQVSLGYELWRQLNGFPALPTVEKGDKVSLPSGKKPKAPAELK